MTTHPAGGARDAARILVVEDEQAIRLALRGLLRRAGYEVDEAESADAALDRLAAAPFDLVVTDLALGEGRSGMEVLYAVKAQRPETAVVLITGRGGDEVAQDALRHRADDCLAKPFDNATLTGAVRAALDRTPFRDAKRRMVSAFERAYLLDALRRHGGNVSRTARSIGMVRQSLQQKIREHDLRSEDWKQAS